MKRIFLVMAVIFILWGCATPYQKESVIGGFDETVLAPNVFKVTFQGNGFTSRERAKDYALLRCAEVCLDHGFKYFAIDEDNSYSKHSTIVVPGQTYGSYSGTTTARVTSSNKITAKTTGSLNTYTTPTIVNNIDKPKAVLTIVAFNDKNVVPRAFDATFLRNSMRAKYKIEDKEEKKQTPQRLGNSTNQTQTQKEPLESHQGNAAFQDLLGRAENGEAVAQSIITEKYYLGDGVVQDYEKAFFWGQKVAKQGDAHAQLLVGVMLHDGLGVHKNLEKAFYWSLQAAAQDDAMTQFFVGRMLCNGEGVAKDLKSGLRFLQLSANAGYVPAQYVLGGSYFFGQNGVTQNYIMAHAYLNLAASSGDEQSIKFLKLVTSKMTPEQIAQAQAMVTQWKPKM